jgi:hypothetical protein
MVIFMKIGFYLGGVYGVGFYLGGRDEFCMMGYTSRFCDTDMSTLEQLQ